jgi:peptidoglycan/LPS O-acetylase OafA/YrhL
VGELERGPTLRHIPALDGLRGVAVGGVLLFHAGHLTGGYLGVDLFFVLSGFLITSLLLTEWQSSGGIRLGSFWARRARRLLPALFGVLIGVAVYAAMFAAPAELNQIRGDALGTLGYVANWKAIFTGRTYWAQFAVPSPLEHTWSLAIEEQFYFLWPPIVLGLLWWRRGSVRVVMGVALALACASGVWMAVRYSPRTDPSRVYLGTDTRAASILLGATLAALLAWRGPVRSRGGRLAIEAAGWIAAAGLAFAWARVDGQTDGLYQGGLFLCGLAVAAMIAAVSHPEPGPLAGALSLRPLRWLGIISYGVYLWHWPVYITLNPDRVALGDGALTVVRIAVTLVTATISYFFLERPIRRGALRGWRIRTWAPAAAVATVIALIVATVGGAPVVEAATLGRDPIPLKAPPAGSTKVMVVGDSVASSLADGMKHYHSPHVQVLNRAIIACSFVDYPARRDARGQIIPKHSCTNSWPTDVTNYRPDLVVIQFSGDWSRDKMAPCGRAYDHQYRARLQRAVTVLGARGATIAIVTSTYPTLIAPVPPEVIRKRVDCVNTINRAVAENHAALIDLNGYLCPKGVCRLRDHGELLRPDGLHFARLAGRTVGQWVLAQTLDIH